MLLVRDTDTTSAKIAFKTSEKVRPCLAQLSFTNKAVFGGFSFISSFIGKAKLFF